MVKISLYSLLNVTTFLLESRLQKGTKMDHELKIVMKYSDDKSIASHNVKIMIDDVVIGMIQDIKFEANAKDFIAKLAVTFPDSSDWDILGSQEQLFDQVENYADQFRRILGAEVNYSKG